MGTLDTNGLYVYDETDQISPFHTLLNLSTSATSAALDEIKSHALIKAVANATERDAYAQAMTDAGKPASTSNPLYVDRADEWTLEANRGSGWEVIGGRQHGAQMSLNNNSVTTKTVHAMYTSATFLRSSTGFARDADGFNIVVPSTGLWLIGLTVSIGGTVPGGRAFAEVIINNTTNIARFPAYSEDRWSGTVMYPLTGGDKAKVQVYHSAPETRTLTGTLSLARISAPKW